VLSRPHEAMCEVYQVPGWSIVPMSLRVGYACVDNSVEIARANVAYTSPTASLVEATGEVVIVPSSRGKGGISDAMHSLLLRVDGIETSSSSIEAQCEFVSVGTVALSGLTRGIRNSSNLWVCNSPYEWQERNQTNASFLEAAVAVRLSIYS